MRNKIKIGFDFDGVIAYNPFRIARPVVALIKRNLFGVKKLKFWYPQHRWQQIFWIVLHESSIFPSKGIFLLKELVKEGHIEAHLITGRYSFLDSHLDKWLNKYKLQNIFHSININKENEQPYLFKKKIIKKLNLHMYIEDNWDIANYLYRRNISEIYWIYNIFDKHIPFKKKYPYLEKALQSIIREFHIEIK